MRGILTLYCLACEREGCLANSHLVEFFRALDTSDVCPRHLDLSANYLGDPGAAALLRTVAVLRWLRAVDLRGTGAGERAVRALADIAPEHPGLRLVDLRGANAVFAMSARRLLALLQRCPRLVVRVAAGDLPRAVAQRMHQRNKANARRQREEAAAEAAEREAGRHAAYGGEEEEEEEKKEKEKEEAGAAAVARGSSRGGKGGGGGGGLCYVPVALYAVDGAQLGLAALAARLNEHMEAFLFAHRAVGRAAPRLAVDLGAAALHFVPATAAAAGRGAQLRAVDALLRGLHANPFLREELRAARGAALAGFIARLEELRGRHDALVAERRGNVPSSRERRAAAALGAVYSRVAAGIAQGAMTDLPSMRHIEQRLREVREEVINRLLEGRERVLPVLLAQAKYFAFNNPERTREWADAYVQNPALQFPDPPRAQLPRSEGDESQSSDREMVNTEEGDKSDRHSDNDDDDDEAKDEEEEGLCNVSTSTLCPSVEPEEELTPMRLMCVAAMDDLRALLDDPHTAARLAVTQPLAEALPVEMRFFLCDLALRRGAGLHVPALLGPVRMVGGAEDPPDILSIFSRVGGRSQLSDVLCAFEEWYRLRQVECYDVTHVSREELLSRMSEM